MTFINSPLRASRPQTRGERGRGVDDHRDPRRSVRAPRRERAKATPPKDKKVRPSLMNQKEQPQMRPTPRYIGNQRGRRELTGRG
jgi:hypothetical protein